MKVDLVRYWKDPDYAAKFSKSENIECNPAGKLVSDDVLKLHGGGTTGLPACSPGGTVNIQCGPGTRWCHFSQVVGGGTCNGPYLC